MEGKLKIAILGYGNIGKKHAEMINQNDDFALVALVDTAFTTNEDFAVPYFYSLQDFLESKIPVNIVAICTPNGLHFEQAKVLLKNKVDVIIEKPITLKSEESIELERLAVQNGKNIFPVMQNRFSPPAQWLKGLLNSKKLGEIFMVQISCYWNRNEQYYTRNSWRGTRDMDGGTLYTQFSHYLDIMYWLFGDITNVKSKFQNFNHEHLTEFEDSGIVTFDFIAGGVGTFNFSTSVWNENLESSLTIIAENGSVKVGGQYMNCVERCVVKDYNLPQLEDTNLANDYGSFKGSSQNHGQLYKNIVNYLKGEEEILTNVQDSTEVLRIIEKIYANKI